MQFLPQMKGTKPLEEMFHSSERDQNIDCVYTSFMWCLISGMWVNRKKWFCLSARFSEWLVINNTATKHQLIMAKALCVKPVVGIWLNASTCPLAPCFVSG